MSDTHTHALAALHDPTPNLETLRALGLSPKTSPAQIQTIFISTATFENRATAYTPNKGSPSSHRLGGASLPLARSCRRGRRGWMARQAVPGAGSGRAWTGPGETGQCIRPGCRAGPGGEGMGKGKARRPGALGDGGDRRAPQRPGGAREGPGNPLRKPPKMCCGAWEIPPRRMGVIKAWAVPLEKGGVRGGPGSTKD